MTEIRFAHSPGRLEPQYLNSLVDAPHPTDGWSPGRSVVIQPAGNVNVTPAIDAYRTLLIEPTDINTITIEDFLASASLPKPIVADLSERFIGLAEWVQVPLLSLN